MTHQHGASSRLGVTQPGTGEDGSYSPNIARRPVGPNAYIVPGPAYRDANGRSLMPADFGERLTSAELDDLVAFLLTRR